MDADCDKIEFLRWLPDILECPYGGVAKEEFLCCSIGRVQIESHLENIRFNIDSFIWFSIDSRWLDPRQNY